MKRNRISSITAILMLIWAVLSDLVDLLLLFFFGIGIFLNRITAVLKYAIFWLWCFFLGVKFIGNAKNLAATGGTMISELIPFLGSLPGFTVGVWLTIRNTRKEDAEYNKKMAKQQKEEQAKNLLAQQQAQAQQQEQQNIIDLQQARAEQEIMEQEEAAAEEIEYEEAA